MRPNPEVRFLILGIMMLLATLVSAQVRVEREYDDDGDYIVEREYYNDDTSRLSRTTHYIYARGGNLVAIVYYKYSRENGQVECHGVEQIRHDKILSTKEFTADELILVEARYRYDRHGRSKGYKVTHYNGDGTTDSIKAKRHYKKDHCYEKTYIDGKFCYETDFDYPRQNAIKLKHSR